MREQHSENTVHARVMPDHLFAYQGQSVLSTNSKGFIGENSVDGYYFRGARYLSRFEIRINGNPIHLCSSASIDAGTLEFSYIYPPVQAGNTGGSGSGMIEQREGIALRGLDIRIRHVVRPAGVDIDVRLCNRWNEHAGFDIGIEVGADFVSLDDAFTNMRTISPGTSLEQDGRGVLYRCESGGISLGSRIDIAGSGCWAYDKDRFSRSVEMNRGEVVDFSFRLRCRDSGMEVDEHQWQLRETCVRNWARRRTTLSSTTNGAFAHIVNKMLAGLGQAAQLEGEPDEWLTPGAGYPLYPFLFGRDGLTSGWMCAMFDRGEMSDHTLTRLGRLQGNVENSYRDEQPGRIIQQARNELSSRVGTNPFDRYYGDYASPLMYPIACAHLYSWTGDPGRIRKHWPVCRRALAWAEQLGDIDGDGFLEYKTMSPMGPRHQGWKDSENAIVDHRGELVEPPIATCEIQGYYFAALQAAAAFSLILGDIRNAAEYFGKARRLKRAFNSKFWVEDGGYIALGLDSKKRPIRSRASNMGHCLASGIIDSKRVPAVVTALFESDLYSGWGIRTLSSANPSYHPLSYHLGSVWPVENASIAFGLRRYGFTERALQLTGDNFELSQCWEGNHLPECIGGYSRAEAPHPGAYPRANPLQTWNAAGFALFTHVLLGLQPFAPAGTLFVDPALPPWLPDLTVHDLRLGGATVSLRCIRTRSGKTQIRVLRKTGSVRVVRQPPINSLRTSLWGRVLALLPRTPW